jgi:hypothetical protein
VFDQTTVAAFPGSSGGGVYLKSDARYVGMIVRGAGETFNLIVPIRRMVDWAKKNKIEWALDEKVEMPTDATIAKIPVEDTGATFNEDETKKRKAGKTRAKNFPFIIKMTEVQPCKHK